MPSTLLLMQNRADRGLQLPSAGIKNGALSYFTYKLLPSIKAFLWLQSSHFTNGRLETDKEKQFSDGCGFFSYYTHNEMSIVTLYKRLTDCLKKPPPFLPPMNCQRYEDKGNIYFKGSHYKPKHFVERKITEVFLFKFVK